VKPIRDFVIAVLVLILAPSAFAQSEDMPPPVEADAASIPPLIASETFAQRSEFWSPELSPEGMAMAYLRQSGKGTQLVVADPRTGARIDSIGFSPEINVRWFRWVSEDKMLIQVSGLLRNAQGQAYARFTRLVLAYPLTGEFDWLVEKPRSLSGGYVVHVAEDGEWALIAHRGDGRFPFPSVFRYELKPGGEVTRVQGPIKGVWDWYADDKGVLRMGIGWWNRRYVIFYRSEPTDELERIARIKPGDQDGFFDAIEIISDSDRGYVLDEDENGRVGLRVYDYSKREVVETFYQNDDWDIERAWLDDGKPIAVFYTDDRQRVVWFDEQYERDYAALNEAVGDREVWVQSRSKDGNRMLVWAGSEADPGVLYLFERETQEMTELLQYRPALDSRQLVKPKAFTYTARDGTDIRAYLTLPKGREAKDLPLIILPHGGPFGIRDELRYNDEVQFLANRGYAVLQPNFRGSGGYGTDFYDLGNGQVGRGMQDDLDDAMDWAVSEGIADAGRVCVVGGSYGGYAALWAVLRNPERYRCAASWAGVTDWDKMLRYDRRYLTSKAGKRWQVKIEGEDDFDLKDVSPFRLAKNLNRPVLLAHGTRDTNVPFKQFELMQKAARKAPVGLTTLVIEGEGHSFSRTESERKWFDALEAFLFEHNPPDDREHLARAPEQP